MTRLTRRKPRQSSSGRNGEWPKHLLDATCCLLLGRPFPAQVRGDTSTLECSNLWFEPLPCLRSKHFDLHDITQVIQSKMVKSSNVRTKAENSSLQGSTLSEARGTTWLEEAEHSLPSVVIVFATTPADNWVAVEVELEVIEQLGRMRGRDAVRKPELGGRVCWDVHRN